MNEQAQKCGLDIDKEKQFQQPSAEMLDEQLQRKISLISSDFLNNDKGITSWGFYNNYIDFFKNTTIENLTIDQITNDFSISFRLMKSMHEKLKQNNFILMKPILPQDEVEGKLKHHVDINIKISQSTPSFDVVQLFCQVQFFAKKYTVLNFKQQSPRHQNTIIGKGAFGFILQCKCSRNNQQIVVKCLAYKHQEVSTLKKHIKQFFICDMMSTLQIGPQILKYNGFDFIIFKDCMEFEMQKCQSWKHKNLSSDVKQGLLKMHLIQMVHGDLKPQNIMYSRRLEKNVILDYGVTKLIQEKWGAKSLTYFQGTYEYCSEEMKQLFVIRDSGEIDLFKNDVCMLGKTFQQLKKKEMLIPFDQEQNEKLYQINLQNDAKNIPQLYELLFNLQYFLYKNSQLPVNPIKQFLEFLAQLDKISSSENNKITILLKAMVFASNLNIQLFQNLYSQLLGQTSQYKFLKPFPNTIPSKIAELAEYMPYRVNVGEIVRAFSFKKVYYELQGFERSQLMYKLYFQRIQCFNPLDMARNLQYVLSNTEELISFTTEECFNFYIKYCSFWGSLTQSTIEKKQEISQKFITNIKSQVQIQKSLYLDEKYLPQQEFIRKKCKNLVTMYGFLLTYCMEGQFTKFKEIYGLLVLNDCIILGFQYFRFLPEYVTKYFQNIISTRAKRIVTLSIINFAQLSFLTNNYFLYTKEKTPLYESKLYQFWSNKVFEELLQFMRLEIDSEEVYYKKHKTLKFLFSQILDCGNYLSQKMKIIKDEQDYLNSVKQLISEVEAQFTEQSSTQDFKISEKAMRYILQEVALRQGQQFAEQFATNIQILKRFSISVKNNDGLNIFTLLSLQPSFKNPVYMRNLKILDNKINCKQISDAFCVNARFSSVQEVLQFTKKILQYPGCPAFNYTTIIRLNPEHQQFMESFTQQQQNYQLNLQYAEIISGLLGLFKRLICIFKSDLSKIEALDECITYLKNLVSGNMDIQLEQEKTEIACLIQSIKLPQTHKRYQLLWASVRFILYPFDSLDYLKARKQFLDLYFSMRKNPMNYLDEETQNNIDYITKVSFDQIVLGSYNMFDQILEFWEIKQLKFILDQKYDFTFQLKSLSEIFLRKGMIQQIAEVIVIYCEEDGVFRGCISQMKLFSDIKILLAANTKIHQPLLKYLLTNIQQVKNKYLQLPPQLIILYTITLQLDQEVLANSKVWKNLMIQIYHLYERLLKEKHDPGMHAIYKMWGQHIWILSIKYINFKSLCKKSVQKKLTFLFRQMLKNPRVQTLFFKLQRMNYFDEFQSYFNLYFLETSHVKVNKLNQKLKNYLKNCQMPEEFENQVKRSEFLQEYNQLVQLQQRYQTMNQLDQAIMKKYGIKDLSLFQSHGLREIYYQLNTPSKIENNIMEIQRKSTIINRLNKNDLSQRKLMFNNKKDGIMARIKYANLKEQFEKKILALKQSEQYQLCQDTLEIIDEILLLQKNKLLSEIHKKNLKQINQIHE